MTGIIICGGKSRRFNGFPKHLLKIGKKYLIEIVLEKFNLLFSETIVVSNREDFLEEFSSKYNFKVVKDVIPHKGTIGGLYSGVLSSTNYHSFAAGCDMPFINIELIRFMLNDYKNYDAIVFQINAKFEPLLAVYSKRCIDVIKQQIEEDDLTVSKIFHKVSTKIISQEEIERFDPHFYSFFNINTPDDYKKALEIYKKHKGCL